jgi:glycerol-3-phosphate O-acyltransferase
MPTHRSYIDFLVVSFVCFQYRLPLPHIAAGDDFLNILIVNWCAGRDHSDPSFLLALFIHFRIFRHSGAFFMRRSFGDDKLYRAIFTECEPPSVSEVREVLI